ncbi:hypothetical protein C6V83_15005 [Gordonia iterans]|uniref:DUF6542 domain-containing protein n=1 Tax=Gordonia iterans TaxID=1004901 RepID=A0A2S0KI47_9ACTN|nr:DUF6542 domain-containing protein [Gordonia iterans]AVM01355.1 hypothetical protein C6V83_15005 [Gordonia iterans]
MASDNSRRAARFGRLSTDAPVPADQQSVIPGVPGVPWWGAVLIAAVLTAIGATIDALANSSLGLVYNLFFLFGCVIAALAVRRRALFTAAVQPPLVSVFIGLTALWGLAQAASTNNKPQGMRQVVLNVALPFSNLFPWIAGVFLVTLLIVLVRWFVTRDAAATKNVPGKGTRSAGAKKATPATSKKPKATRNASSTKTSTKNVSTKSKAAEKTKKLGTAPAAKRAATKSGAKSGTAKSGTAQPATAKPAARKAESGTSDSRRRAAPRPAQTDAGEPHTENAPAGNRRPARRPAAGERSRADQARPAESRAERPRPAEQPRPADPRSGDPRPGEPSPDSPRAESARAEQSGDPGQSPQRASAGRPAASASRPVRKAPTVVGQATERPVRRAAPQVIPPRPATDRPRRTAGQSLREQGAVEDLTLGLDD